jgi:hypothetical protein
MERWLSIWLIVSVSLDSSSSYWGKAIFYCSMSVIFSVSVGYGSSCLKLELCVIDHKVFNLEVQSI